jgi:hypothetical protein
MRKMNQHRKSIFPKLATVTLILLLFIYAQCPTIIPPESGALPPDPGEAGKATVAGIDSDNDGVRDDIQRYIALNFPDSKSTRKALMEYAKACQLFVHELDDEEKTMRNAEAMNQAITCAFCSLRQQDEGYEIFYEIEGKFFNTADRIRAYIKSQNLLGGKIFTIAPTNEQCNRCGNTGNVNNALSNTGRCPSNDFDIKIYFGNGMFNSIMEARLSMSALQILIGDETPDGEKIRYSFSYNQNEKWWLQLIQVLVQKDFDIWDSFLSYIRDSSETPESVRDEIKSIYSEASANNYIIDTDLRSHVDHYRADIFEGKKVVVVAHSQGNFYANNAYGRVGSKGFGIVSVATPANFVKGGGYHTTLTNDLVIALVRLIMGALDGNVTNSYRYGWLNHNFIGAYMMIGSKSREQIKTQVIDTIKKLEKPETIAEQGIITITLTWGSQPDVDLHVFEPSDPRTHVFYGQPQGSIGYLDVDDIDGYGPEHYYAKCEDLKTGTYDLGVNYFSGSRAEVAKIVVHAYDKEWQYRIPLPEALGEDGDDSPKIFARIIVSLDEENYYTFKIESVNPTFIISDRDNKNGRFK